MARVVPESRLHERRRRRRNVRVGILCVLVLLFFTGLVMFSRAPFIRVTSVVVTGADDSLAMQVQAATWRDLLGSYWYLFARGNVALYPKGAIPKDLLVRFPELKSVSVRSASFHTIEVAIVERSPVAVWCGSSMGQVPAISNSTSSVSAVPSVFVKKETCFFVDQDGLVYAPVGDSSQHQYQKYFGATSTTTAAMLPAQYLTPDQFKSLTAFVTALGVKVPGDAVDSVEVDAQQNARAVFAAGFQLRFLLNDKAGDVLEHFDLAESSSVFKAHQLADFLYLDLRFGDKLYYKLKTK